VERKVISLINARVLPEEVKDRCQVLNLGHQEEVLAQDLEDLEDHNHDQ